MDPSQHPATRIGDHRTSTHPSCVDDVTPGAPEPPGDVSDILRLLADLFTHAATAPEIDWTDPAVLLTHPLQRARVVPYDRGGGLGRAVTLTRTLWTATDPVEATAIGVALNELPPDPWVSFAMEQEDESLWSASAFVQVELASTAFTLDDVPFLQSWMERRSREVLLQLAAAVRPAFGRVADHRSLWLRRVCTLVRHALDGEGPMGEDVELVEVGSDTVTVASGFERLPALLRYDEARDRIEVVTLLAGFDGRATRAELREVALRAARATHGRDGLRVLDVPGTLGWAVGVRSEVAASGKATALRVLLEAHLDVARALAGVGGTQPIRG